MFLLYLKTLGKSIKITDTRIKNGDNKMSALHKKLIFSYPDFIRDFLCIEN